MNEEDQKQWKLYCLSTIPRNEAFIIPYFNQIGPVRAKLLISTIKYWDP